MNEPQPVSTSLLDGVIKFGKEFGAIALILAFYMGQDAGLIGNPTAEKMEAIHKELQEIKGQNVQHNFTMQELTRAVESQGEQLEEEAKKRQIKCVLRATTPEERKACMTSKE